MKQPQIRGAIVPKGKAQKPKPSNLNSLVPAKGLEPLTP
jgi:hypothetical protein